MERVYVCLSIQNGAIIGQMMFFSLLLLLFRGSIIICYDCYPKYILSSALREKVLSIETNICVHEKNE